MTQNSTNWSNQLYYTADADSEYNNTPVALPTSESLSKFTDGNNEGILKVWLYKHKLENASHIPGFVGSLADWHELLIIDSTNWFWSFEIQNYALCVQRGKRSATLKTQLEGRLRDSPPIGEEEKSSCPSRGESVKDVFKWIQKKGYLNRGFQGCREFASELFEAIDGGCI